MRKRLYEVIEASKEGDKLSIVYDLIMICTIVTSILPLAFKENHSYFYISDMITTFLFIVDYFLRWSTADYKLNDHSVSAFVRYPFTPWAVVDLISILPGISFFTGGGFQLFKLLRILRIFKAFRYSKSMMIIYRVIKRSRNALLAVCTLAIGYILISALVIYNVEGDSFKSFFEAFYWATVSLTTVGYGDIYPVTPAGRAITMISSLFGIAIVALPSGVITAGYMEALREERDKEKEEDRDKNNPKVLNKFNSGRMYKDVRKKS